MKTQTLLALVAVVGCQGTSQPEESVAPPASVVVSNNTCMQDVWAQHGNTQTLNCTANDVRIATATNVRNVQGEPLTQCIAGSTFSFIADFKVVLTAQTRFDVGLYFATDGDPNSDGALRGNCDANTIKPVDSITGLGSPNFVQLDGSPDTCGDIDATHNPQIVTVQVDNVLCEDSDGDTKLNLPNCTSWRQPGSNETCQTAFDAFPGSPSKCNCDNAFNVPILVEDGTISVTKTPSPLSLPEPGGEFTFTVTTTNTASFTSVTLDSICDDRYGTVAGAGCPAGTLGTVNSSTCSVPQTLAPGASYTCAFKANLLSNTPTTDTDTVTVTGHDANNKILSSTASAQVAISDVPPTAQLIKRLDSLLCSVVRYGVEVKNTSTTDPLTVTTLTDSAFGDLTTVHDNVLATTCSTTNNVVAVGGSYTCTFDARFCGGSHTNTVSGTVNDNDGNVLKPDSNAVTVNVGASTGP